MRPRIGWLAACVVGSLAAAPALAQAPRPAPAGAAAAPTPRAVDDPERVRKVDALLARWEVESRKITQLDANFKRVNRDVIWKRTTEFEGRALVKAPNLACLDIKKIDPDDKAKKTFHERIICTGAEVVQYDATTRQIIVFPLPKEDRQRALQEGPLPFLFNMESEEVKKRYRISLVQEARTAYRLQIIPLEDIDRDAFSEALLDLNKETFLPDALQLRDPNGKETQTYLFTAIKTNAPIDPKNFQRVAIDGWKVVVNPGAPGRPAGAPEAPRQPAMRPRVMPRTR